MNSAAETKNGQQLNPGIKRGFWRGFFITPALAAITVASWPLWTNGLHCLIFVCAVSFLVPLFVPAGSWFNGCITFSVIFFLGAYIAIELIDANTSFENKDGAGYPIGLVMVIAPSLSTLAGMFLSAMFRAIWYTLAGKQVASNDA
jgi:hypothetical protein